MTGCKLLENGLAFRRALPNLLASPPLNERETRRVRLMIPTDLLQLLACPDSLAPLLLTADGNLVSTDANTRRLYRVEDDIPILLIDESTVLGEEEHQRVVAEAKKNPANQAVIKARKT